MISTGKYQNYIPRSYGMDLPTEVTKAPDFMWKKISMMDVEK